MNKHITKKKLLKFLDRVQDDTIIYFDTEARQFNCHIVPITGISKIKKNVIDENEYCILHCNQK